MHHARYCTGAELGRILPECGVGAVILLATVLDPHAGMLNSVYWSFDSPESSPELVAALDRLLPDRSW